MTDERDFDRLARAWLELSPDRAPERSVVAILQAVETTPQIRTWPRWLPWRGSTMTRLSPVMAVVAITLVAVGGLFLINRPNDGGIGAPSASPSPSAAPSQVGDPLPSELVGGWVAPSRGTSMEQLDITTIALGGSAMDSSAPVFSIDVPGVTRRLGSNVVSPQPGVLRFILSTPGSADCELRAVGDYDWSLSADGQWLTFEPIEDACQVRESVLAGTWQRNLGFRNTGGPGVATAFEPYMSFTLPTGSYTAREYAEQDTLVIDREDASYKVWKDLDGFLDPCDITKGRRLLDPGIDGFLAYLDDPRFTVVRQAETTIDGHRAVEVELRFGENIEGPCWTFDGDPDDLTGVLTWMPRINTSGGFWNDQIGGRNTLVVTEVDGATLVFEFVTVQDGDISVDHGVLDSVRFLDVLPTAP